MASKKIRVRHHHFYVAAEVELTPGWEASVPVYRQAVTKTAAENQKMEEAAKASWVSRAERQIGYVRIKRLAATVVHFYSGVSTAGPEPGEFVETRDYSFSPGETGVAAGQFLTWATRRVLEIADHRLQGIAVRCVGGIELRHLIRCEALAAGELVLGKHDIRIPTELYYGTSTESELSPLCPKTAGDASMVLTAAGLMLPQSSQSAEKQRDALMGIYRQAGLL